jgi:hypothetical protein
MPNGVELKAERRKPSGEKNRDIENIPSLTGVLAHFRFHEFNAILLHASGPKLAASGSVLRVVFRLNQRPASPQFNSQRVRVPFH